MNHQVKEITLERARELIGDKDISDENLKKILESVKIFCKVAYELYQKKDNQQEENKNEINL